MRKLFFVLAFALVGMFAFANETNSIIISNDISVLDKESKSNYEMDEELFMTCSFYVSGYDEWGCYFKQEWSYSSPDMTTEICNTLATTVIMLWTVGQYL